MAKLKRATICLDPTLHRALRVKAAETETSVSDLVNGAVRLSLSEDAADLAVFEARVRAGLGVRRGAERPEAAWQAIRSSSNVPPPRNSRASLLKFAVLYSIDDTAETVTVVKIGNRRDQYR